MSDRNKGLKLNNKICDSLVHCRLLENSPETRVLDEAFVTKILVTFFDKIGVDSDKIQRNFPDNLLWPHPETMHGIIRCINLFCSLSNLIKETGIDDIQLEDIINTDTGNPNKILQYICDFYYYYHDEYNHISHFLRGIKFKCRRVQELKHKVKEYETKLMEIIIEKQQMINENKTLRENIENLQLTLIDKSQAKSKIEEELANLKLKQDTDEQSLINYHAKIEQLDNLKVSIEHKLERYPVAYNDQLEQLCKAEDNKRNEELSLQQIIAEKNEVLRNKEAVLNLIRRLIDDSRELSEIKDKYEEKKKEDVLLSEEISNLEWSICEYKKNNEKEQLQIRNLNEELKNVKRQRQRTIQDLNNARKNVLGKIDIANGKVKESMEKKRLIIEEIELLKNDIGKVKTETDRLVKECQEICKQEMAELM